MGELSLGPLLLHDFKGYVYSKGVDSLQIFGLIYYS